MFLSKDVTDDGYYEVVSNFLHYVAIQFDFSFKIVFWTLDHISLKALVVTHSNLLKVLMRDENSISLVYSQAHPSHHLLINLVKYYELHFYSSFYSMIYFALID